MLVVLHMLSVLASPPVTVCIPGRGVDVLQLTHFITSLTFRLLLPLMAVNICMISSSLVVIMERSVGSVCTAQSREVLGKGNSWSALRCPSSVCSLFVWCHMSSSSSQHWKPTPGFPSHPPKPPLSPFEMRSISFPPDESSFAFLKRLRCLK